MNTPHTHPSAPSPLKIPAPPPPPAAGNFSLALFSMLQVSVGDGWAPYIVRPLVGNIDTSSAAAAVHRAAYGPGASHLARAAATVLVAAADATGSDSADAGGAAPAAPAMNRGVALFFILYFFASGICLLGVVHAILLDEFMVRT